MNISVIYPSRGRAAICKQTLNAWMDAARKPEKIEWILSVDQDDPTLNEYVAFYSPQKMIMEINRNRSAIDAINIGAVVATNELFVVISDDFLPFPNWDYALLEALAGKEDFIVKTHDGLQPWIITLPILDIKYYNRFGYIYPPHILHMFADTWMTHVADLTGLKITLDLIFEHLHYSAGKSKKDIMHLRNENTWKDGERKYIEGAKTNFGLAAEDIKGTLQDKNMMEWLKNKI